MKDMFFKAFKLDLAKLDAKALDEGRLTVCFATMGVIDKDGDVALPGFYGNQDVAFLPTHDWSHVPLGKGVTREEGDRAIADIAMNLEIPAAKDWLSAIKFDLKNGRPIQEYSYGFKVLAGGSRRGDYNGQQVRYLAPIENMPGCKIWEVSPVLVGAGENTGTIAAKAAEGAGDPLTKECAAAHEAVDALIARCKSLADLRAKKGRSVGVASRESLASLAISLETCVKELAALAAPEKQEPGESELKARAELARMRKLRTGN